MPQYQKNNRISVEITPEQEMLLRELIPWGMRTQCLRVFTIILIDFLKEHRELGVALLIQQRVRLDKDLKLLQKEAPPDGHD